MSVLLLEQLAEQLAQKIAAKYRVDPLAAKQRIFAQWQHSAELMALCAKYQDVKSVARTRVYKNAERGITRKVYYELRQYQQHDSDQVLEQFQAAVAMHNSERIDVLAAELVQAHVSTKERAGHLHQLQAQVERWLPTRGRVVDVGCGLLPMAFDCNWLAKHVREYQALDRSVDVIAALELYSRARPALALQASVWQIETGWQNSFGQDFDLALLCKVVPVVARQQPSALEVLADVPAKHLLVTGCRQAMVKQRSIAKRERATLKRFADDFNLHIEHEFETEDEVGLILCRQ